VTVDNAVANFQVQTEMLELFEFRDALKWGDGLPPLLFSLIMEYVMKVTVDRNTTLCYKLMQIFGYAIDMCFMDRMKDSLNKLTKS
jgi:hypothetical protein